MPLVVQVVQTAGTYPQLVGTSLLFAQLAQATWARS